MENQKLFEQTIKEIETQFGKGSIMSLDSSKPIACDVISTGSINLNKAIGVGGYPKGRIIEIYGNESSGKTTLALQAVASCQRSGGKCAYVDVEHALDQKYCLSNGVDTKKLLLAQPETGEQSFAIVEALIKTGMIDLIIVDSVAALVPEAELNGEYEDQNIGLHARLMSKGLRILQTVMAKYQTTVIFINQIREKVGILFGDNKTTPGGWAMKFYSSLRIELKRIEALKSGTNIIGIRSLARVVKNKVAPPMQSCYLDIYFNKGFDNVAEIIENAISMNIIQKSGSWFYYGETKLAQGKEGTIKFLTDPKNKKLFGEITKLVLKPS